MAPMNLAGVLPWTYGRASHRRWLCWRPEICSVWLALSLCRANWGAAWDMQHDIGRTRCALSGSPWACSFCSSGPMRRSASGTVRNLRLGFSLGYFAGAFAVDTFFRGASFCKYVCPDRAVQFCEFARLAARSGSPEPRRLYRLFDARLHPGQRAAARLRTPPVSAAQSGQHGLHVLPGLRKGVPARQRRDSRDRSGARPCERSHSIVCGALLTPPGYRGAGPRGGLVGICQCGRDGGSRGRGARPRSPGAGAGAPVGSRDGRGTRPCCESEVASSSAVSRWHCCRWAWRCGERICSFTCQPAGTRHGRWRSAPRATLAPAGSGRRDGRRPLHSSAPHVTLAIQVLLLDAGVLLSLYVGWRIARGHTKRAQDALLLFAPLAVVAALLYGAGIWIFLQPMQMRGMVHG